jgi:hypothetical protein
VDTDILHHNTDQSSNHNASFCGHFCIVQTNITMQYAIVLAAVLALAAAQIP